MRPKKYLGLIIVALCMGCGQDVREKVITEDNMQEVIVAVRQSDRLTDEEKEFVAEALAGGILAQGITKALGAKKGLNPVLGKTVGQVINEQRASQKEQEAQEAKEKRVPTKKPTGTELLDQKYGFRDVTFGMPLSSKQFLEVSILEQWDDIDMKKVRRPKDKLKIGEAVLKEIAYLFYKDKLFRVNVGVAEGLENANKTLGALQSAYGPPTRTEEDGRIATFSWIGHRVRLGFIRRISKTISFSSSFSLVALDIKEQMERDQLPDAKQDL